MAYAASLAEITGNLKMIISLKIRIYGCDLYCIQPNQAKYQKEYCTASIQDIAADNPIEVISLCDIDQYRDSMLVDVARY
jgi:hypothetical protein